MTSFVTECPKKREENIVETKADSYLSIYANFLTFISRTYMYMVYILLIVFSTGVIIFTLLTLCFLPSPKLIRDVLALTSDQCNQSGPPLLLKLRLGAEQQKWTTFSPLSGQNSYI